MVRTRVGGKGEGGRWGADEEKEEEGLVIRLRLPGFSYDAFSHCLSQTTEKENVAFGPMRMRSGRERGEKLDGRLRDLSVSGWSGERRIRL